MTGMYDDPKSFDGKLKPYPHEELGVEVRRYYWWLDDAVGHLGGSFGSTNTPTFLFLLK